MPGRHRPSAHAPRTPNERGTALLEAAFVVPIFLALLLGAMEGGVAFYERLSVKNMSLAGARSASGQGNEALADYHSLQSVRRATGGVAADQITMIVVYKAAASSDRLPVGCKTASVAGVCNRYAGADLTRPETDFGCTGPPGPTTKVDSPWCPTGRKVALTGTGGPPDHVGVYVEAQHRDLTGAFGGNVTLRSDSVFRLEPRTLT